MNLIRELRLEGDGLYGPRSENHHRRLHAAGADELERLTSEVERLREVITTYVEAEDLHLQLVNGAALAEDLFVKGLAADEAYERLREAVGLA